MTDGSIRLGNPNFRASPQTYRRRMGYTGIRSPDRLISDFMNPVYQTSRSVGRLSRAKIEPNKVIVERVTLNKILPVQKPKTIIDARPFHSPAGRRAVTRPADKQPKPQRKGGKALKALWKHASMPNYALPALAMALFLLGAGVIYQGINVNKNTKVQAEQSLPTNPQVAGVFKAEGDPRPVPDERKPDPKTYGSYVVAPDLPKFLRIKRFDVFSRVLRQGVLPNGEVNTPTGIYDVGWYEGSAKPGEAGAALLSGHVSGPTAPGSLFNLKSLNPGDTIEVERGDGHKLTFVVVDKETKKAAELDMAKALKSLDPTKPGLNLITCTGRFDAKLQIFESRVIVYTVLQ